jgi:hypothetical protein
VGRARSGLADVDGIPHYFQAADYDDPDEPEDSYFVWPASEAALALEREHWAIFVAWHNRYRTGKATTDSHPAHGGINTRFDELTELLAPDRAVPPGVRRLTAAWQPDSRTGRYHLDGPGYLVRWRPAR